MTKKTTWMLFGLGLVGLTVCADTALARRGRGGERDRVDERIDLTFAANSPFTAHEARLRVRRKSLSRQLLKMEISRAPSGFDLDVFFENGAGTLVDVGDLIERRAGVYKWRVRTKKGQALPFGAADVAELSGRAVEIRTAAGQLVAGGNVPGVAPATGSASKGAKVTSAFEVDEQVADAVGASSATHAVDVSIRVRRKSGDREELQVEVDHAAEGLALELWLEDGAGTPVNLGALHAEVAAAGGVEYEISFRTDRPEGLPFGAASVADLAGLRAEVRTAAGDVLAVGTVPTLGQTTGQTGDDNGDDGAEDETGDDNGDDGAEDETGDDNGNDGAEDETGDDDGDDGAEDETGDDDGDDGAEDETGDDDGDDADETD